MAVPVPFRSLLSNCVQDPVPGIPIDTLCSVITGQASTDRFSPHSAESNKMLLQTGGFTSDAPPLIRSRRSIHKTTQPVAWSCFRLDKCLLPYDPRRPSLPRSVHRF